MSAAVRKASGRFPSDDSEIPDEEATLSDSFWADYAGITDTIEFNDYAAVVTSDADEPNLAPFMTVPLTLEGQTIAEATNKRARRRVAVASCKDGKPVIFWSPNVDAEVSPYSFVFFRFHEAAHFVLKHVTCGASAESIDYPSGGNQESDADCSAYKRIAVSETGQRIVGSAYERLWQMNRGADSRYPASRTRANRLRHNCPPL